LEPFLQSIATWRNYELSLTNSQLQVGASLSYLFVSASEFLSILTLAEIPGDGTPFWQDFV
jgi:hypothetical protein